MHEKPMEQSTASWTSTQKQLVVIWAKILPESDIGLDESFIDLGGDSVTAALCVNRMRKGLSVEVPMGELLGSGVTIRTLAAAIDDAVFPAASERL